MVIAKSAWLVDLVKRYIPNQGCVLGFFGMLLLFSLLVTCGKPVDKGPGVQKLKVVTTLFPLYDFARQVGKERSDVSLLLPPGVEPHSFEPKPGDVLKLESADLFIYTGRQMEPWAETILKGLNTKRLVVVDDSAGILPGEDKSPYILGHRPPGESGDQRYRPDVDPHIWLDLVNARKMVDTILVGFALRDPDHKEYYTKNAEEYKEKLEQLDAQYQRTLTTCDKRVIIHGGHFAFNYLAKHYHLVYLSAYSGSPDAEPTARRLAELEKQLKKYDMHYIYYEELITPRVAEIIANETGAHMLKLNGAHNVTRGEMGRGITFIEIMEENLKNLKVGLECR
ncbi:MAG: zinc ABC transporter substrate-binding protein [Syntrophorhabdales bacterium]|jgi:zinc transport system substrate-binding protein